MLHDSCGPAPAYTVHAGVHICAACFVSIAGAWLRSGVHSAAACCAVHTDGCSWCSAADCVLANGPGGYPWAVQEQLVVPCLARSFRQSVEPVFWSHPQHSHAAQLTYICHSSMATQLRWLQLTRPPVGCMLWRDWGQRSEEHVPRVGRLLHPFFVPSRHSCMLLCLKQADLLPCSSRHGHELPLHGYVCVLLELRLRPAAGIQCLMQETAASYVFVCCCWCMPTAVETLLASGPQQAVTYECCSPGVTQYTCCCYVAV